MYTFCKMMCSLMLFQNVYNVTIFANSLEYLKYILSLQRDTSFLTPTQLKYT